MDSTDTLTQQVISFHGHLCPGLSMGIRMANRAMELLGVERSQDEELVAVVEMDCCAADGIQYITGCTFGKGNLIFRDYGKVAATFSHRTKNKAVRLCIRPEALDNEEINRLREMPEGKSKIANIILAMPARELLKEQNVSPPAIPPAQIYRSVVCSQCGEAAMELRIVKKEGASYCIPCSENL